MLLSISMLLWVLHMMAVRARPVLPATAWWAVAYSAWVSLALAWGPSEGHEANQFYKHVAWLNIPLAYALIRTPERRNRLLWALTLGAMVMTLRVMSRAFRVWQASRAEDVGIDPEYWFDRIFLHTRLDGTDLIGRLIDLGVMQDGQRLAVGLLAAVCVCGMGAMGWRNRWLRCLPVPVIAIGLVFSFKRGPWFAVAAIAMGWALYSGLYGSWVAACLRHAWVRRVAILVVLLAAGFGLHVAMPEGPRAKWAEWEQQIETASQRGGRVCMWMEITPALVREYPFGIGYKALTNEKMKSIARHVESRQSHVHSNVLQAAVDGGWPGVLLFLGWMWSAFRDHIRYVRRAAPRTSEYRMAWAFLLMFTTLFLVGVVEYQLGTGQITMLYGTLMGCGAAAARRPSIKENDQERERR